MRRHERGGLRTLEKRQLKDYNERTLIDLLIVKHSINTANTAYEMQKEGDTVSGMTNNVLPSFYVEVNDENI